MRQRVDLNALAMLVRKFGTRVAGGGFEVILSRADALLLTNTGTFQETQDLEGNVHWQYFPNPTIEGEIITPESVTPSSETCGHHSANPYSDCYCTELRGHEGYHRGGGEIWPQYEDPDELSDFLRKIE